MEELAYGTTFNHTFIFILFYNKKQKKDFRVEFKQPSFLDKRDTNVHCSVDTVIKLCHVSSRSDYTFRRPA